MKNENIEYYIKNSPLVQLKEESFHGEKVYVVKYKNKVFYKNLWTPELLMLRGVVLDANYKIISHPFDKVFNHNENDTDIPRDNRVLAVQKINGFMAAATFYKDKLLVSTTGTISSDFAKLAEKWIKPHEPYLREFIGKLGNPTYIFEICDPSDPHIVEEAPGVYLLGARAKSWDASQNLFSQRQLDELAPQFHMMRPWWRTYGKFSMLLDEVKTCKHEGYMIYDIGNNRPMDYIMQADPVYGSLKIKSPFYLAVKFMGRMNDKRVNELLEDPKQFKQNIDEEFYKIVDYIHANPNEYLSKSKEERIKYIREYFLGEIK